MFKKLIARIMGEKMITALYGEIRKKRIDSLLCHQREIRVKKGDLRYTLLVFEDKNRKLKFNLSRH